MQRGYTSSRQSAWISHTLRDLCLDGAGQALHFSLSLRLLHISKFNQSKGVSLSERKMSNKTTEGECKVGTATRLHKQQIIGLDKKQLFRTSTQDLLLDGVGQALHFPAGLVNLAWRILWFPEHNLIARTPKVPVWQACLPHRGISSATKIRVA